MRKSRRGLAVIGEHIFEVKSVYLSRGQFCADIHLAPTTEEVRGHIYLYDPDGLLVVRGKEFIFPPHQHVVVFTYGVVTVEVKSADEQQDASALPGWYG